MSNIVETEFGRNHPGVSLNSEDFLEYLLRLWNRGFHLKIYEYFREANLLQLFSTYGAKAKYEPIVRVAKFAVENKNETDLERVRGDLFQLVYGITDPHDVEQVNKAAGGAYYHLWFKHLRRKGQMLLAWKLFDAVIYKVFIEGPTQTDPIKHKAIDLYMIELHSLMFESNDPQVLSNISHGTVSNLKFFYLITMKNSKYFTDDDRKEFCQSLLKIMAGKEMYGDALDFYCAFKGFFDLNESNTLEMITQLAVQTEDYQNVNVFYGDINAVKSRIDKYTASLEHFLGQTAEFILRTKEKMDTERHKVLQRPDFKANYDFFFYECGIYTLCTADYTKIADDQKDRALRQLLDALVCFYDENHRLTSSQYNRKETDMLLLAGHKFGLEARRIRSSILAQMPGGRDIEYKKYVLSRVIPRLQDSLLTYYLNDMSETVNYLLMRSGRRILQPLDEQVAKDAFDKAFKSYSVTDFSMHTNPLVSFTADDQNRFVSARNDVDKLWMHDDVKMMLTTAEWTWQNHKHFFDNPSQPNDSVGQELTYVVADYLKAVEVFLMLTYEDIHGMEPGGLSPIKIRRSDRNGKVIGSREARSKATMGSLYNYVTNEPRVCKPGVDNIKVQQYLKDWTDRIRNCHFHKHTIFSVSEAKQIRTDTIILLRRLLADLRC